MKITETRTRPASHQWEKAGRGRIRCVHCGMQSDPINPAMGICKDRPHITEEVVVEDKKEPRATDKQIAYIKKLYARAAATPSISEPDDYRHITRRQASGLIDLLKEEVG